MDVRLFRQGSGLGGAVRCIACGGWKGDALEPTGTLGKIVSRVFSVLEGMGGLLGDQEVDLEEFDEAFTFLGDDVEGLCRRCREGMVVELRRVEEHPDTGAAAGRVADLLEVDHAGG